jgi:hypothetical protein
MTDSNRKLFVGVIIHIQDGQQSAWESGVFQKTFFSTHSFVV